VDAVAIAKTDSSANHKIHVTCAVCATYLPACAMRRDEKNSQTPTPGFLERAENRQL